MDEKVMQILITALLAAFGSLARLLSQKEKTAVQFAAMISGCMVAAFSGVMAHFVSEYFSLGASLTYIIAGISGWIGPQVLDIITDVVLQKTGLNVHLEKKDGNTTLVPIDPNKPISGTFFENMSALKPQQNVVKNAVEGYYPQNADIPAMFVETEIKNGVNAGYQENTDYPAAYQEYSDTPAAYPEYSGNPVTYPEDAGNPAAYQEYSGNPAAYQEYSENPAAYQEYPDNPEWTVPPV